MIDRVIDRVIDTSRARMFSVRFCVIMPKKVKGWHYLDIMARRHELSDEQWERVKNMLPPERTGGKGRPAKDNRQMLNGMVWIHRTGAPWRDLPERFGPWNSVYSRYYRWLNSGLWDKICQELNKDPE